MVHLYHPKIFIVNVPVISLFYLPRGQSSCRVQHCNYLTVNLSFCFCLQVNAITGALFTSEHLEKTAAEVDDENKEATDVDKEQVWYFRPFVTNGLGVK